MAIKRWALQAWIAILQAVNTEKSVERAEELRRTLYNDLFNEVFKRSK